MTSRLARAPPWSNARMPCFMSQIAYILWPNCDWSMWSESESESDNGEWDDIKSSNMRTITSKYDILRYWSTHLITIYPPPTWNFILNHLYTSMYLPLAFLFHGKPQESHGSPSRVQWQSRPNNQKPQNCTRQCDGPRQHREPWEGPREWHRGSTREGS